MNYLNWIELSRKALGGNITSLAKLAGKRTFAVCVKANAYGHGLKEFINMAGKCGINHFSVFSSGEARKVKEYLTLQADIMIMGWINDDDLEWIITNKIDVFIFDFERLQKLIDISKRLGIAVRIHVDLETGMNRTGFAQKDIGKLIKILTTNKEHYEFRGLCTHFAGDNNIQQRK